MHTIIRTLLVTTCVAAAACGGSPTGPGNSGASGATIAGTAATASANKGVNALGGTPLAGATVTIAGTNLSTTTNAAGYFQIGGVPSGNVRIQFRQSGVDASAEVQNVSGQQLVTIEVQVSGSTATIVSDTRSSASLSICHKTEGVNGYHMVTVAPEAEPAHRGHGDAKPTEPVPGTQAQIFDQNCQAVGPAVDVEKSTNGDDADSAPGPTLTVGDTVTWTYIVRNSGTVTLSGITVQDNKEGAITCPKTSLTANESMTCSKSGVAVEGQYSNEAEVKATGAHPSGTGTSEVSDKDMSHYLGVVPTEDEDGPKVELCHGTGNGSYHLISVSVSAEPAHRAHGDAKVGEAVPGQTGKTFGAGCSIQ